MMDSRNTPRWGNSYSDDPVVDDLEANREKSALSLYSRRRRRCCLSPTRMVLLVLMSLMALSLIAPDTFTGILRPSRKLPDVNRFEVSREQVQTKTQVDPKTLVDPNDPNQPLPSSDMATEASDTISKPIASGATTKPEDGTIQPGPISGFDKPFQEREPVTPSSATAASAAKKPAAEQLLKPTVPEQPEPAGPALNRPIAPQSDKKILAKIGPGQGTQQTQGQESQLGQQGQESQLGQQGQQGQQEQGQRGAQGTQGTQGTQQTQQTQQGNQQVDQQQATQDQTTSASSSQQPAPAYQVGDGSGQNGYNSQSTSQQGTVQTSNQGTYSTSQQGTQQSGSTQQQSTSGESTDTSYSVGQQQSSQQSGQQSGQQAGQPGQQTQSTSPSQFAPQKESSTGSTGSNSDYPGAVQGELVKDSVSGQSATDSVASSGDGSYAY